jgi:hypothetical protein
MLLTRIVAVVFSVFVGGAALVVSQTSGQGTGRVTVDLKAPGTAIPPRLYGIFYEEINHAGDGGLYGELVRNRGFEDANLPPTCTRDGNFIVPPRTPHFDTGKPSDWRLRWDVEDPHPSWTLAVTPGGDASIELTADNPLTGATPHSLLVNVRRIGANGHVAVVNSGYWGIGVKAGEEYRLSFWARSTVDLTNAIAVTLEPATWAPEAGGARPLPLARGVVAAASPTVPTGPGWKRYSATMRATCDRCQRPARAHAAHRRHAIGHGVVVSGEDVQEPAEWVAAGSGADGCRSEAGIRAGTGRLLRGRHHDRKPCAVEAIAWTD